jgi:WD40 repeat protein
MNPNAIALARLRCSVSFALVAISLFLTARIAFSQSTIAAPLIGLEIRDLAFSPDGKLLAAVTGQPKERGQVILWDLDTRKPRWVRQESDGVPAVAFAPDGRLLAIGVYDHTAKLLDPATGNVKQVLRGHDKEVRAVAFSPDGKTLATGSWDMTIKLWNIPSGELRQTLTGHADRIFSVAFSPDGTKLISTDEQAVKVWDLPAGQARLIMKAGIDTVIRFAVLSPDGRWIVAACWNPAMRVWRSSTGEPKTPIQLNGTGERLAFLPGTDLVAVCGSLNSIQLVHLDLNDPSTDEEKQLQRLIAQLDDDSYDAREAAEKSLRAKTLSAEPALRRALSSSSVEVRIRVRRILAELGAGPVETLRGHQTPINVVVVAPSGKILASGSKDGIIKLWDVASRKELASLQSDAAAER